jgi:exportin-1
MVVQTILPPGTDVSKAYASGSDEDQFFIQNLAMFFTSFYKSHISVLETTQENQAILLMGLEYLIGISYVEDTEVFKVCLDYWNSLVCDLFQSECNMEAAPALAPLGLQVNSCFKVFCPTLWPLWLVTTTSLLCHVG